MKNKIAIASAFIAASSFSTAEIVINDFLSFEGFVDMSYAHADSNSENAGGGVSDNSFAIDQVEISWLFDFDPVTARIDLDYQDGDGDVDVEQAFVTYALANGGAITAGRYASMLGFEAFEPTGLYQYSVAYGTFFGDDLIALPGYAQGVKYTLESDSSFFGISLQDGGFNGGNSGNGRLGGSHDTGVSNYVVEVAGSISTGNGLTIFAGGAFEQGENNNNDDTDTYALNSYVTYETGAWIFAAELILAESQRNAFSTQAPLPQNPIESDEVLQALLMANFAYSDKASVTARLSYSEIDEGVAEVEFTKYTLAHGYAFTDNLSLVNEVSFTDIDFSDGGPADAEELLFAAELIFAF